MIEGARAIIGYSPPERNKRIVERSDLNPQNIGDLLGQGFEHVVYEWNDESILGKPSVVKVPTPLKLHIARTSSVLDAEVIRRYFPGHSLVPDYKAFPVKGGDVIIQERIHGSSPSVFDEQFITLIKHLAGYNRALFEHTGASLDFFEVARVLEGKRDRDTVANFRYADDEGSIKLIDTSLFHRDQFDYHPRFRTSGTPRTRMLGLAVKPVIAYQARVIQKNLGVDII